MWPQTDPCGRMGSACLSEEILILVYPAIFHMAGYALGGHRAMCGHSHQTSAPAASSHSVTMTVAPVRLTGLSLALAVAVRCSAIRPGGTN